MQGKLVRGLVAAMMVVATAAPALAQAPTANNLETYLDDALLAMVFPGADAFGPVEGEPPAATAYKDGEIVGYIYEQYDVVQGVGYSKRPFHLVVGLDLGGKIAGARLTMHVEPIAILGRTDDDFHIYLRQFSGIDVRRGVSIVLNMSGAVLEGEKFAMRGTAGDTSRLIPVDAVSRTTTSSILFSDSIIRAARRVARSRGIALTQGGVGARLDVDSFAPRTWQELIDEGSLGVLHLTVGDVAAAFAALPEVKPPRKVRLSPDEETYVDLYVALVSPAAIGVNLLGRTWHDQYTSGRNIDDLILFVATDGDYGFQDAAADRPDRFARLTLTQDGRPIALGPDFMKTIPFHHAREAPDLVERGLLFYSPEHGLDPTRPWHFELAITGEAAAGVPATVTFALDYRVPERLLLAPAETDAAEALDWRPIWRANAGKIAILCVTLALLVVILSRQEFIARRRLLHRWVRIGFLSWTLVWLGWYAGAQLTVIGLLNIAQSLESGFSWAFFMVEPLIFVLTVFVFACLVLWGRAIFCGWLCPFGALQELLNKLALALKVPQIRLPDALQRRLIAIKYVIFLGLLGLTFLAFDLAIAGTNVEPFKTAIIFRFDAPLLAVLYALALLSAGLFIERFYCRFVCPLGAGLAILGRVRLFNWLKRRAECGNPCHRCEAVCPTGAIGPSGKIDMNECFYCLDCQVTYYDDHECPPLAAARKRIEAMTPAAVE